MLVYYLYIHDEVSTSSSVPNPLDQTSLLQEKVAGGKARQGREGGRSRVRPHVTKNEPYINKAAGEGLEAGED